MNISTVCSLVISLFILATNTALAATKIDGMYVNTFGDAKNQSLIFVHGGPGFNSWDFELTTAEALAKEGYYVVVYDERGQGRSDEVDMSKFNYKQYADDLKLIIDTLKLSHPVLIGHSHGGPISINFEEQYPNVAKKIVLVSAPVNFWGSMHTIFENCSLRYAQNGNTVRADQLSQVYYQLFMNSNLPKEQVPGYVSASFIFGLDCGLYKTSNPTVEAKKLKDKLIETPLPLPHSGETTAVTGFLLSDNYVHFNGIDYISTNSARFCGIYGDEDGLFNPLELNLIKLSLQPGQNQPSPFVILKGASHGIYIDQQRAFFDALKATCAL